MSSSYSSPVFIFAVLFHDALAQNYGYQGYGAPAPSLVPVTSSIYASNVASGSLSSFFPLLSESSTADLVPSSNTVNAIEATSSTSSDSYPSPTPEMSYANYNITAIYASATQYLTADDTSISIPSIASATSFASFGPVPASIIRPTNYANASTTANITGISTLSEPTYVNPSVVPSSAPPLDYAGETITSGFGGPSFTNNTLYSAAQPTASAFNVTAISASASAYLNSTSLSTTTTFSEPSYLVPSIVTSSAPPLNYAGEPLTSTASPYSSTNFSEPAYVAPSVATSSAPPLDFAGNPITSSPASTRAGMPYGNVTSVYAQPTASQYNITVMTASATAYLNTTNLSTGSPTPMFSLATVTGTSIFGSSYSGFTAPLSSPVAPYGFPNSSIVAPTAGDSFGSAVISTASSSATSTVNVPITLTVIPVSANTSLTAPISSEVPAVISSALSQITANASAVFPTNITAGLSSAIAQITSLAGYGTSSTLVGPETFNASNTMPPESILAGISSAVAQITSLAGSNSASSQSEEFESATPPSTQSTMDVVNASATSTGQELVSSTAAASTTALVDTGESPSSASTSASVLVTPSTPTHGYGSLPSTLITQIITATAQVSTQASAGQTSSAQSSTHKDSWLADLLAWAAGVVKDVFEEGTT